MSRVGKEPIATPAGVDVQVDGQTVTVRGPKGELTREVHPLITVEHADSVITVRRPNDERQARSLHGLTRSLINNMVVGVTEGYQRTLDVVGVGYRVTQQGQNVVFQVGLSHLVEVAPIPGTELEAESQTRLDVRGIDKQAVGHLAAKIRKIRPPDPYKGKGIRYAGEAVHLKPGKGGKKA